MTGIDVTPRPCWPVGVGEDLAAAVRAVNGARERLPEPRPEIDGAAWRQLRGQLDRCRSAARARELIETWSREERSRISARLLHAPLRPLAVATQRSEVR